MDKCLDHTGNFRILTHSENLSNRKPEFVIYPNSEDSFFMQK